MAVYTPTPSQQDEESRRIDAAYQELLQAYLNSNHRKKVDIIDRAYRFAREAHKGARRRSGEPYILHPIAVAKIVISELGLGSTSICAALLHDVVEDTEFTREDIADQFGETIASLVEGLTKISGGIFGTQASLQAANFRKLLLSMSTDIRVILIKMADRLHNMRTLGSMRPEKQFKIAGETLYIYAPLAHRLGLFQIKSELEDLAFKYEHPQKYAEIKAHISATEAHREKIVSEFVEPVKRKLDEAGFKYEIKARVKSVYSINRKMETKHVGLNEIYDIYAVRVIFENEDDALEKIRCWQIYTYFAEDHMVHPDRLRDWTTKAKANGYRALHLTAMGPEGKWIEVQIRSRKMDELDELGLAAHWKYKEVPQEGNAELEEWMNQIKEILARTDNNELDMLETVKLNLFSSEIYVFTPKGDLLTLPAGSTVLDMAFAIHSELGIHCMAGKINHKLVPIGHVLGSGDQVEIITSDSQIPQTDWLRYCHSAKGKSRLLTALRKDRRSLVEHGKKLLEEMAAKEGVKVGNETLSRILGYYHLKHIDEFYFMLAKDEITLSAEELKNLQSSRRSLLQKLLRNPFSSKKKEEIEVGDPEEVKPINRKEVYELRPDMTPPNYLIESCCTPVPGDDVLGFVTEDEKVVVHKVECERAMKLKSSFGSRLVATKWGGKADKFIARISLQGLDRQGMLMELTTVLSEQLNVNLRSLNIHTRHEVFFCEMSVMIDTTETVDKICNELKKISGVKFAKRIS